MIVNEPSASCITRSTTPSTATVVPSAALSGPATGSSAQWVRVAARRTGSEVSAVYGVASRLAGSLTAVAAIVMVFADTLAGPRVHAAARTELGRTIAVTLQAIGFGGVVGALVIAA